VPIFEAFGQPPGGRKFGEYIEMIDCRLRRRHVIKTSREVQFFSGISPVCLFRRTPDCDNVVPRSGGTPLRYLDRLQPLALLVMRLALGAIMTVHGYHEVFGGLHHHAQMAANLGLPAWISALTEFFCGLLILVGFFTRAAALAVFLDLFVAIWKVHVHNGLIGTPDHPGYEFALAAAALAFALIFSGAGPIAIDHVLRGGGRGVSKRS
jgi:putative oxidoreductase